MAGDQVEIQLPKTKYPERTSFTATAYFRTRSSGAAATPTTVHYRIDNLSRQQQVKDWTSVSPSTSASITVASSENTINSGNGSNYVGYPPHETLQLTVAIDKDLSTMALGHRTWRCENLFGVT